MHRRAAIVLLLLAVVRLSPGMATAHETAEPPGTPAGSEGYRSEDPSLYGTLPDASVFGDPWQTRYMPASEPVPGTDARAVTFWFVDDTGSRIVISRIDFGDDAMVRDYAIAFGRHQVERNGDLLVREGYASSAELDALVPPDGCSRAFRTVGRDCPTGFRVAITVCVDDTAGQLIIATVSGSLTPDGHWLEGEQASDFVAGAIIAVPR